jgi:hypothetical protein
MTKYNNTNRGALFKNDRKEQDSHPDLSGQINIEGKEYWLSGWSKRNDDGSFKVLSLSVKPKESRRQEANRVGQQRQATRQAPPPARDEFLDDDIPF